MNNETLPPVTEGITFDEKTGTVLSYNTKILKYGVFRLPEGVRVIPKGFFCDKLFADKVILPSTLLRVGYEAFERTIIGEVIFLESEKPRSICLDGWCFADVKNLRRVTLCEGVNKIDSFAFRRCEGLTELRLPCTLKEIGSYAFAACDLTEVALPQGLRYLDNGCFQQNRRLTALTLPATVHRLPDACFEGCPIKKVTFLGSREAYDRIPKSKPHRSSTMHYDNSRVGYDWCEEGPMVAGWIDTDDFELTFAEE